MPYPEFFVGIDFGHGETSVSRIPGTNGHPISRIPLRVSSNFSDQKVFSAICRGSNGEWQFVWSKNDLKLSGVKEGFKDKINNLSSNDRDALREFAKLVFKTIQQNDGDLAYDPLTGEANFVICIANPSDWRRENPNSPKEYLTFFQEEAKIKPAKMCINESDAAFYTKFDDYSPSDKVFVIDLGSSTIDFTTYSNSTCILECCWGHKLGAHFVEDKLVEYGYTTAEEKDVNVETMLLVTNERERLHLGKAESALSLAARFVKEAYFSNLKNDTSEYNLEVKVAELVPGWPNRRQVAFYININSTEFDVVIKDYISDLSIALINAKNKLNGYGISPNKVLLSGGASRMPFVLKLAEETFKDSQVIKDNYPEWVVSDGAAKYIQFEYNVNKATDEIINNFNKWFNDNFLLILEESVTSTLSRVVRDVLYKKLKADYLSLDDNDKRTLFSHLRQILVDFMPTMCKTKEFTEWANAYLTKELEKVVNPQIKKLILDKFGRDIEVSGLIDESIIKDIVANQYLTDDMIRNLPEQIHAILYNEFVTNLDRLFNNGLCWNGYRILKSRKRAVEAIVSAYSEWKYQEDSNDKILGEKLMRNIEYRCREFVSRNRIFLISK